MSNHFFTKTDKLLLESTLIPWDTKIFGFPVASIERIQLIHSDCSKKDCADFESWRDNHLCKLVSCRLHHHQLRESMLLEAMDFRFVEMVLHPTLNHLERLDISDQNLTILPATQSDIAAIKIIAQSVFKNERFHVDPRLDPEKGNLRYGQWVANVLNHPSQQLLKIVDANDVLVAFFIIEIMENHSVYWHLTAVSPLIHGSGYGYRTWLAMIRHHCQNGQSSIKTTISARNTPVLNLYSKLNFQFLPPEMTFHWVRTGQSVEP